MEARLKAKKRARMHISCVLNTHLRDDTATAFASQLRCCERAQRTVLMIATLA